MKGLYHFRSKIWRRHRVPGPRFFQTREFRRFGHK